MPHLPCFHPIYTYGNPCPVRTVWVAIPPIAIMANRPFKSSEARFLSKPALSLGANLVKPKSVDNFDCVFDVMQRFCKGAGKSVSDAMVSKHVQDASDSSHHT